MRCTILVWQFGIFSTTLRPKFSVTNVFLLAETSYLGLDYLEIDRVKKNYHNLLLCVELVSKMKYILYLFITNILFVIIYNEVEIKH